MLHQKFPSQALEFKPPPPPLVINFLIALSGYKLRPSHTHTHARTHAHARTHHTHLPIVGSSLNNCKFTVVSQTHPQSYQRLLSRYN